MAEENPLKPVSDMVDKLAKVLDDLIKGVIGKISSILKPLFDLLDQVKSAGSRIAETVGKKVIDRLLGMADTLTDFLPDFEAEAKAAAKAAKKILDTVKKAAAAPAKVFAVVKKLVARFAAMFRKIVSMIAQILKYLNPIGAALAVINSFKAVLRLVFNWIAQVSGALSAVKKVQDMVKKIARTRANELKTVTKLVKETAKLKPA